MRTTQQMRDLWAPSGRTANQLRTIKLWIGGAAIHVDDRTGEAFMAIDAIMSAWAYPLTAANTYAYNDRTITGGKGKSLHAYGIACDYNSAENPYGRRLTTNMPRAMVEAIEAIRTNEGRRVLRWGGDWNDDEQEDDGSFDAMHYELQVSPGELSIGVDWGTVRGPDGRPVHSPAPVPHPTPVLEEDDEMKLILVRSDIDPAVYLTNSMDWAVKVEGEGSVKSTGFPVAYGGVAVIEEADMARIRKLAKGGDK